MAKTEMLQPSITINKWYLIFFLIIGYLYSSNGYYLGIPYDFL
jgi:hypothetical protein